MEYGPGPDDRALHIVPLCHVGGMQAFFLPYVMVGAMNAVLDRYAAGKTLETIEAERVTTLFAVPTQIQEMLFHPRFRQIDTASLRLITAGGAAIASSVMQRVIKEFCPRIFNGYGPSEASLTLILHPDDAPRKLGSCGQPTLISECRVIETGDDTAPTAIVAPGEIGRLIVHGMQAMAGCWNNPFETSRRLRAGWIYTGDLFSKNEDGFCYFHGRADDMIVSGGENIYSREVEDVLYKCPGVQEAAVSGNLKRMKDKASIFGSDAVDAKDRYRNGIQQVAKAIWECEVPLIAAVNGPAYGAGYDTTWLCDIRIASTRATFAENFVRVGLTSGDGGAWLLPRRIGLSRTVEMTFTVEPVDAATALEWGLVSKIVEPDELLPEARRLADRIAKIPPRQLRMAKRLIREGLKTRLGAVRQLAAACQGACHQTDHTEAVGSLLQTPDARFNGR